MNILLVDDDRSFSQRVEAWCPQWNIVPVEDLQTAIALLKHRDFDVIFLDLGLPDSQDLQTFHAINSVAISTPVVIVTGCNNELLANRLVDLGAAGYVYKDRLSWKELQALVCEVTGKCVLPETKLRQIKNLVQELKLRGA